MAAVAFAGAGGGGVTTDASPTANGDCKMQEKKHTFFASFHTFLTILRWILFMAVDGTSYFSFLTRTHTLPLSCLFLEFERESTGGFWSWNDWWCSFESFCTLCEDADFKN